MINAPTYRVELRLNDQYIGDARRIAESLTWTRRRTAYGVDEISFTVNDRIFAKWCEERGTTIAEMLKPYALDCRIVRNGEALVGGFLATMPSYSPNAASANLGLSFDGYLNLFNGVYIRPTPTTLMAADTFVETWISDAETRATTAGKPFGVSLESATPLATIERTFDNYETVKEAITNLCDNVDGAGQFDVIFNADRTYYITDELGRNITGWQIHYPAERANPSAIQISASEVQGFASHVIALGSGEVSSNPDESTAIISEVTNSDAVAEYGYCEVLNQYSSVSNQTTLNAKAATDLYNASNVAWQPSITLSGAQIAPSPTAEPGIWIGDYINVNNRADWSGTMSGRFRVNELSVSVSATNAETITPTIERATS